MIDANDHIRSRLRQAREEAELSQRELAEMLNSAQGTISDLERGRIRINAADLVRFAQALDKPIQYFFPGVKDSELDEREELLIRYFRRLAPAWQESILTQVKIQAHLYESTTGMQQAAADIEALPEEKREDAAYEAVHKWLRPFLRMGLRVFVDDEGRMSIGHRSLPGFRIPFPQEDEKDRRIALEMQRRYDLGKSNE